MAWRKKSALTALTSISKCLKAKAWQGDARCALCLQTHWTEEKLGILSEDSVGISVGISQWIRWSNIADKDKHTHIYTYTFIFICICKCKNMYIHKVRWHMLSPDVLSLTSFKVRSCWDLLSLSMSESMAFYGIGMATDGGEFLCFAYASPASTSLRKSAGFPTTAIISPSPAMKPQRSAAANIGSSVSTRFNKPKAQQNSTNLKLYALRAATATPPRRIASLGSLTSFSRCTILFAFWNSMHCCSFLVQTSRSPPESASYYVART